MNRKRFLGWSVGGSENGFPDPSLVGIYILEYNYTYERRTGILVSVPAYVTAGSLPHPVIRVSVHLWVFGLEIIRSGSFGDA